MILRELRKSRGLTLTAFSKRFDVTYQQIQKYESGQNRVAAATLYRIAKEFNVPMSTFFPTSGANAKPSGEEMSINMRTSQTLAEIQDKRVRNTLSVLIAALAVPRK